MVYFFLCIFPAVLALEECAGFGLTEAPAGFLCDDFREKAPFAAAFAWATSA